jgi:hypothetical protein
LHDIGADASADACADASADTSTYTATDSVPDTATDSVPDAATDAEADACAVAWSDTGANADAYARYTRSGYHSCTDNTRFFLNYVGVNHKWNADTCDVDDNCAGFWRLHKQHCNNG